VRELADSLPAGTAQAADGDPVAAAVAACGGVDILVALDPISPSAWERVEWALRQQGLGGVIVGLETAKGATVGLLQGASDDVRVNLVQSADGATPSQVAEVIAFLASSRAAGTDRATVPVG
jgi:hypothetical protein